MLPSEVADDSPDQRSSEGTYDSSISAVLKVKVMTVKIVMTVIYLSKPLHQGTLYCYICCNGFLSF